MWQPSVGGACHDNECKQIQGRRRHLVPMTGWYCSSPLYLAGLMPPSSSSPAGNTPSRVSLLSQMENSGASNSLSWSMLKKGGATPCFDSAGKASPCESAKQLISPFLAGRRTLTGSHRSRRALKGTYTKLELACMPAMGAACLKSKGNTERDPSTCCVARLFEHIHSDKWTPRPARPPGGHPILGRASGLHTMQIH